MIAPDPPAAMGFTAQHMKAELTLKTIILDLLTPMGHGVDGAGDKASIGIQYGRPGMPGSSELLHQIPGPPVCRFQVHVIMSAKALDPNDIAGFEIADIPVVPLFQHGISAMKPSYQFDPLFPAGMSE